MQLLIDEVLSMTNQEWAEHYQSYCRLKEQGQIRSICGYSRKYLPEANEKTVYFKFRNLAKTGTADDVRVIKNLPALPGKKRLPLKPKLGKTGVLPVFSVLRIRKTAKRSGLKQGDCMI